MADGFEHMIDAAQSFFGELAQNNTKAWFEPKKALYNDDIRKPATFFADLMSEDLARLTGKAHAPKVFRIYRDVRFSKDKTPLNTHLHIMWSPADQDPLAPTWFWGFSPTYFMMGMGVMGLQGEGLTRYRALVDAWGASVQEGIDAVAAEGGQISDWGPAPLKRVPKPYAPDHPHADLLKRKALAVSVPMSEGWRETGLVKASMMRAQAMMPLWQVFRACCVELESK